MNEQRRQAAIEAGARALYGDCQPPWDELPEALRWADRKDAAAVIDAAAPHLAGEPVGYLAVSPDGRFLPVEDQDSARAIAGDHSGWQPFAIVPVEDAP